MGGMFLAGYVQVHEKVSSFVPRDYSTLAPGILGQEPKHKGQSSGTDVGAEDGAYAMAQHALHTVPCCPGPLAVNCWTLGGPRLVTHGTLLPGHFDLFGPTLAAPTGYGSLMRTREDRAVCRGTCLVQDITVAAMRTDNGCD